MQNPLHIAICDDTATDAAQLQSLIIKSGTPVICEIFKSGEDFLHSFCRTKYNLIFMDIYMDKLIGTKTVELIREIDEDVLIAFTTTSIDHTLESYRLGALKYIEKPVTIKPVLETLEFAVMKQTIRPSIQLLIGGNHETIPLDNILYFEMQNHNVVVNTLSGNHRISQSVKIETIEAQLPSPPFLRCHHSFIVNLRYVQEIDKELMVFIMKNSSTAHIRRTDFKKVRDAYENYLFSIAREDQ